MKAPLKNFKGIMYIQLSELPLAQQELLLQTIHKDLFIKILINEKIISNCLQYVDYERWYNNVYKINASEKSTTEIQQPKEVLINK